MMNLSIAKRIWLLVGLAAVLLAAVGVIGFLGARNLQKSIQDVNGETIPRATAIDDIKSHAYLTMVNALRHTLILEADRKVVVDKDIAASKAIISDQLKRYETLAIDDTDKQMLAEDRKLYAAYLVALDKLLDFSNKNDNTFARLTIDKELDPATAKLRSALEAHQAYSRTQAAVVGSLSEAAADRVIALSGATILLGIAAIAVVGAVIGRGIVSGVTGVQTMVARIESELDFSLRVPVRRKDELGRMAVAFNRLLERLQNNLSAISDSATKVAVASKRMAETSVEVAQASELQSGSAADMAASIEQLTVSISHVGSRAQDARHTTDGAGALAEAGRVAVDQTIADIKLIAEAVQQTSQRIHDLGSQSDRISSVVAVIREVADQTNLLALNAAIEAARAGEQGRGFAVVADEVRKLAERTAKSTQEITAMVEGVRSGAKSAEDGMKVAVERVAAGVARTDQISQSIHQISDGGAQTVEMVNEISSAIREQASASNSIAQQVERVAQMAEQCSSSANGSAASARELDGLADEMHRIVSAYKL